MSDLWFPGADLSKRAPVDGGSITGGQPKCLWHDTETIGLPLYADNFFPNMTIDPMKGKVWQHIPANRAARALRNEPGGTETNRLNVFQIEVIGFVNRVQFHPVMHQVAAWLHVARNVPLSCSLDWLRFDDSFGNSRVRMSNEAWANYAGHCGHMHAPENAHGDPGWPFPINSILGEEADDMLTQEDKDFIDGRLYRFLLVVMSGQANTVVSKAKFPEFWDGEHYSNADLIKTILATPTPPA